MCHMPASAADSMSTRTLFILAGYSSVGKTTLSRLALQKKIPLFGPLDDELFQSTALPPKLPESLLSTEEKLQHGCWHSLADLPVLRSLAELPPHIFLHIDLVSFAMPGRHLASLPPKLVSLLPRSMDKLADDQENELVFTLSLSLDFFSRFDRVVVNTLYAPWERIAKQWQGRRARRSGTDLYGRKRLFDTERPRTDVHRAIYAAWLRSVGTLDPQVSLLTEVRGSRIVIRKVDPPAGAGIPAAP